MSKKIDSSYDAKVLLREYKFLEKEDFLKNISEELKKDTFLMDYIEDFYNDDLTLQVLKAKCVTEYDPETDIEKVDSVRLGSYPQSDVTGKEKEPIEWIVLEKSDNDALLLSKKILDYQPYAISGRYDDGWFDSGLEKWLHKEFLFNAFNRDEIDKLEEMNIPYQTVSISDDYSRDDDGYENQCYNIYNLETKNKITLMSFEESNKYFCQGLKVVINSKICKKIATKSTEYAKNICEKSNAEHKYAENEYYLRDVNVDEQQTGGYDYDAKIAGVNSVFLANQYVDKDGGIYFWMNDNILGVRPMIRIRLK